MRATIICLAAALLVAGCQGGGLTQPLGAAGSPDAAPGAPGRPMSPGGSRVALSAADLAQVDAYVSTRNSQWILGDEVDVYASKEYFAQALSLNAKVGMVHRKDQQAGSDSLTTMTYVGHPGAASAISNPRVLIGTGLTASARKVLRVRLMKTSDPNVPVRLRIVARGKAARGQHEKVTQRGATLQIGGSLRWTGNRWVWSTVER